MTFSNLSFLSSEEGWTGVDAWESPGIISAATASKADENASKVENELTDIKSTHHILAASAQEHVKELTELLGKVELSTATKAEMERLSELDKKIASIKKELMASKSIIQSKTEDLMKSKTKSKEYALLETAKERDIKSVIRMVRDAEAVDLAFLLDCTGSMSSYIASTKESIKSIVRRVSKTNQGLQLRVAVVGYRDIGDARRFEVLDFTTCLTTFETFVGRLVATGGGDTPEDVAGAIQKANGLSWTQPSRVTFLITDAPCHGIHFHPSLDGTDSYPAGTPGINIMEELQKLKENGGQAGMSLHFGRITEYCDEMVRVFDKGGITFEVSDLQDPKSLASTVTTGVRKSISKSITASRSKSKSKSKASEFASFVSEESGTSVKGYTISIARPSPEEWLTMKTNPVKLLKNKPVTRISDLKEPLCFGIMKFGKPESSGAEEANMLFRRARSPFAEGESRLAFYGKIGPYVDDLRDVVVKLFKKGRKSSSDRKRYLAQMEVSTIAHYLAEMYNQETRPDHCAEIKFLSVCVIEDDESEERYCMEEILPGAADSFEKFSNNTGYWNEDEINQSLLLFTQFTHTITGGYLMVTDLQGVRQGNRYILTDPAILCTDLTRFGQTNLGSKFIDKCMESTATMLEEYGWDD